MREKDCQILLSDCQNLLEQTQKIIEREFINSDSEELIISTPKYFFENCRSILDYIAFEIYESKDYPKGKVTESRVFFPYGKNSKAFSDRIKTTLPNLKTYRPDIYSLFENLQDYKIGDNKFLGDMMKLSNPIKHRNLPRNKSGSKKIVGIKGLAMADETSYITIIDSTFNGIPIDQIEIKNGKIVGKIPEGLIPLTFNEEEKAYLFPSIDKEVLSFMSLCYREIQNFAARFYSIF